MKKILSLIIISILALVILVPIPAAAASSASEGETSTGVARPALAINAPDVVFTGTNFKIQVVNRYNGVPMGGAGVWAVKFDVATGTEPDAVSSNATSPEIFLGWTDSSSGVVVSAFKQAGFYFLVAAKDGYDPGFAGINAKLAPKPLAIKAPVTAFAGVPVNLLVYDRNTGVGISRAGIWALTPSYVPALTATNQENITDAVRQYGQFLGFTDDNGKLTVKFERPDHYLLVAVKDSYTPAFAKILVQPYKALVVKAPSLIKVLEPVSIRVLEKSVLTVEIPVPQAGVWAVGAADVTALDETADNVAIAQKYGRFLGWTDDKGYVNPAPSFSRPGKFWLIAVKNGYQTGITTITVTPPLEATPVPSATSPASSLKIQPNSMTPSGWQAVAVSILPQVKTAK